MRHYIFTKRGLTDRFFCGSIYKALPSDNIKFNGDIMTFAELEHEGLCRSFATKKEALNLQRNELIHMRESDRYAEQAMQSESVYECEGVDDMIYEI